MVNDMSSHGDSERAFFSAYRKFKCSVKSVIKALQKMLFISVAGPLGASLIAEGVGLGLGFGFGFELRLGLGLRLGVR